MLSPERWRVVESALDRVLDVPEQQRAAVLDEICGDDAELRREVEALLAAGESEVFFDTDAASYAAPALDLDEGGGAAIPERLGGYRLLREIGAGGMSRVYLAEREGGEFEQRVAVKILRAVGLGLDEGAVRFRAERQILASLEHPAIARVFDGGSTEAGLPYLVMEYVEGRPITEVCRERALSLEARLDLFDQVCDAVAFAHSRLVVHRDLKPSNILVTEDLRVKLLDFGIAKLLDPDSMRLPDAPLTRTGFFLLTPEYAAPEQLRGEAVTTATDVFTLGALLYELLTARRPGQLEVRRSATGELSVSGREPAKPSTVVAEGKANGGGRPPVTAHDLAGDLDTIVLEALREAPRERYRSVDDLRDDLRRFREGRPIQARPATIGYRARKFVARNRLAVGAAVVVAAALVLGAVGTLWQASQAREEARRARVIGEFMLDLFEGADPDLRPGESITALELLEGGAERLGALDAAPGVRVDLERTLGELFGKLGEAERAETLLRSAHRAAEANFGPHHPRTAETRLFLGRRLALTGDPAEAEDLLRASLDEARANGLPPLEVAERMRSLAIVLVNRGAFDEAESLLRDSIEIHERQGEADGSALGDELLVLGALELQRENFSAAEAILHQAAETRERHLGPEHAGVAAVLWELANGYLKVERFADAEQALRRALAIRRAAYPDGHPDIARTLGQLGMALVGQDRLDEASQTFAEAMDAWQDRFGRNRLDLAEIYSDAGVLAYRRGDLARAAELTAEAVGILRGVLAGSDHEFLAASVHNLGFIEKNRGNYEAARPLLFEGLEIRRRLYPGSHQWIANSLNGLAGLERDLGNFAAAEPLVRESEAILMEQLGAESPAVAETRVLLASVLVESGRAEEGRRLLEDALDRLSGFFGENDSRVGEARLWLGVALSRLGRPREARPFLDDAAQTLASTLGTEAPITRRAREELRDLPR